MAVTDVHYGFDKNNKMGSRAPRLMDRFVKAVNGNRVDFAVDLGDRVISKDPEGDRFYLEQYARHFNRISTRKLAVNGNHDLRHMQAADIASILGCPEGSYSEDINNHHIVCWNPNVLTRNGVLRVHNSDLDWLKRDLASGASPAIILSHIPLDNHTDQDPQDSARPNCAFYKNGQDIRDIIEESNRVRLCSAGHLHRNRINLVNGITYITQQSLTQKISGKRRPHGAYVLYEMDDKSLKVTGYGAGQKSFTVTYSPA